MTKMFFWATLSWAVVGVLFWITHAAGKFPLNPLWVLIWIFVCGAAAIGGFWMLYTVIRQEKHPLLFVMLALIVPYFWVGYYVERVRERGVRNNFV